MGLCNASRNDHYSRCSLNLCTMYRLLPSHMDVDLVRFRCGPQSAPAGAPCTLQFYYYRLPCFVTPRSLSLTY